MPVYKKTQYGHVRLCLYRVVEFFLPLYGFQTCIAMLVNVYYITKYFFRINLLKSRKGCFLAIYKNYT